REGRTRWHDWHRCRQPQKIPGRQLHLRAEEIVIRRKIERRGEDDVEEDLLPCRRTFPTSELIGARMDAVHYGVSDREGGILKNGGHTQGASHAVEGSEVNIAG